MGPTFESSPTSSATPSASSTTDTLRHAGCVFAEDEARILYGAAESAAHLDTMIARRVAGEPLEIIVGWSEFCGLRITLEQGVFVPRRRTEFLARRACSLTEPGNTVLDLCCGSGAVGAVLQSSIPSINLYAVDIEPAAVHCARQNIAPPGHILDGDLYDPLPLQLRGRIDVIAANAPYVPTDSIRLMPPEARLHEPRVSLDGGADGLDVQRRVAADAPEWLRPGGHLLVETSAEQVARTVESLTRSGLLIEVCTQMSSASTVVIGTRPTSTEVAID